MTIVIIGSGLAGYLLAKELRALNQEISLCMITQSDGSFYSKPQLSTAFAHKKTADMLVTGNAEQMGQELQMAIYTKTQVINIDTSKKMLSIKDAGGAVRDMAYGQLVLACGSTVIHPIIQGNGTDEILSVKE